MRAGLWSLLAGLCAAFALEPACAQTGPVIVIPGKPGVPVIMNGLIVDGAVVYGDWGLGKPNNSGLIIEGPIGYAPPGGSRGYFPATGHQPRVGRQEVEPPASSRRPVNTDFHRDWSIGSEFDRPVTQYPPFDPPPVIVAPRGPGTARGNAQGTAQGNAPRNKPANRDGRSDFQRDVR